ncbi:cystathionine gamma-lyase [Xinfangfangia sp. CPCC 101601]|uniref:Cystathionine gamma-lyase n=1 Tax=Pseudogemmobacter lacusdianii TaxID=3069608 RepID=A0ABU0W1L7_9RHOB|nr:cystathionine gamma-lyase [Xinfangfangia sp. CPCC 101601]MDQ2066960.1 cystathionine gamma-lyase [Xinfangfangia sp. CPCC 101601]
MSDPIETRLAQMLHHRKEGLSKGDPVVPPITASATYHLPDTQGAPYIYGRNAMPTWDAIEAQLSLLEAAETVSFPSGMAAISAALFASLKAGEQLVIPSDGYYVTRVLSEGFLKPLGIIVREIPTADYATADFTGVAVVYLETPSNPGLDVIDIAAVAARAHAAGAIVIADNTTMTPLLQRPLDLGADLVVAADTKAPAGHSDVLFGHVSGRDAKLMGRVRDWRRMSGAIPGPFEAFLVHRGLETLELRLARMCASAQVLAERLAAHPKVLSLRYPGLAGDASHWAVGGQMANGGFLIGLTLADAEQAEGFLTRCKLIEQTTSFGGTHSAGERRARWGDAVPAGFIRLSVGVEPLEPLWASIEAALA